MQYGRVVDPTTWGSTFSRAWPPQGATRPFVEDTIAGGNGVELARGAWPVPCPWMGQFVVSTEGFDPGLGDSLEILVAVVVGAGRAQGNFIVAGGPIPLNQDFSPLPPILAINVAEAIAVRFAYRVVLGPALAPVPAATMTVYTSIAPFAPAMLTAGVA